VLWSILISGIPERYHSAQPLLYSLLEAQSVARMPDVELLYFLDNKRRLVGAKRNDLLNAARGEYVSFIDDDDEVAPDYVRRIHDAIVASRKQPQPADVICFPQRAILQPHGVTHECTYSLAHFHNRAPENRRQLAPRQNPDGAVSPNSLNWTGPPAHTMVWRREIVKDIRFPAQTFGEDVAWVDAACEKAASEICLDGGPLYIYRFDEARSTTR
jgi:glycosyltransferase involved in cell wall biosynthesis